MTSTENASDHDASTCSVAVPAAPTTTKVTTAFNSSCNGRARCSQAILIPATSTATTKTAAVTLSKLLCRNSTVPLFVQESPCCVPSSSGVAGFSQNVIA